MTANDLPLVSVWQQLTGSTWAEIKARIPYSTLDYEPRHNDPGQWTLTAPFDDTTAKIVPGRLLMFEWRGYTYTALITSYVPSKTDHGELMLTVSGTSALGMLSWSTAWRAPLLSLASQPAVASLQTNNAESVVRSLVADNMVTRRSDPIVVAANLNRGATIRCRPNFDNLQDLVLAKATRGGIGVSVGLVRTSGTRATLTFSCYAPSDKSARVKLSEKVGTITAWTETDEQPTVTRAIVPGLTGFQSITSTASSTAATAWGGHRERVTDFVQSDDANEISDAGLSALDDGATTVHLEVTAADAAGTRALEAYNPGDMVAASLLSGLDVVDTITGIEVAVSDGTEDLAVVVTPKFGDPDANDAELTLMKTIQALRRQIQHLQARDS